jgi:hypothetical protein
MDYEHIVNKVTNGRNIGGKILMNSTRNVV